MKTVYLLFCICACYAEVSGQFSKHIIELTDKGGTQHSLADPTTYLSEKAIARRALHHIAIDSTDLPLSAAYLDSIASVPNVTIFSKSKWLNQVLIRTNDPAAITKIRSFSFVRKTQKVANNSSAPLPVDKFKESAVPVDDFSVFGSQSSAAVNGNQSLNYGNSLAQIRIHEGEFLHKRGYTGQGVEMAVMDAGFRSYLTNPAFDSVRLQNRILGTWDFVANHASVNEDHDHGANCFSIIAANRPGAIVGSAPHAKFWLFRTEDVASESPVEEQNWIAAAEFADSAGAKMFSTSLGYNDFDDPSLNYNYAKRDGNTAMITRAADLAARKGILVMNSAGNFGDQPNENRFVLVPADGDSVVAVGAVDVNGVIGNFSSGGPNSAGRLKPNIVSVGVRTVFANTAGNPVTGDGTSYSNPNVAGLFACLWQAFPEKTNMQIIDAVQRSADRFHNPDARYGYGIPNFRKAYQHLMASSFKATVSYARGTAKIGWEMKDDSSVTYIVERKLPGSAIFEKIDTLISEHDRLDFSVYNISDDHRLTTTGNYIYRINVHIGKDTSFNGPELAVANAWPALVADSLSFSITQADCANTISWALPETADVIYTLEKRAPGATGFANVTSVRGKGNAFERQQNIYKDVITSSAIGQYEYRLHVAIGADTSFYSTVLQVQKPAACSLKEGYIFTPSPFNQEVLAVLNMAAPANKFNIAIYDISGRVVKRFEGSKPPGNHQVRIPVAELNPGVYIAVMYLDNKRVYKQQIVK